MYFLRSLDEQKPGFRVYPKPTRLSISVASSPMLGRCWDAASGSSAALAD